MAKFQKKSKNISPDTEVIVKKSRRGEHLIPIKKGTILNPNGRPLGSRNKLGEAFLKDLVAHWEENGQQALYSCLKEDPAAYCKIVASILPREININEEESILEKFLEQFETVEEIRAFRAQLAVVANADSSTGQSVSKKRNKTVVRGESNRVY